MDAINRTLLVEGKNDSYVVSALLNSIGAAVKTKKARKDADPTAILEFKSEANIPVKLRVVGHGFPDVMKKLPTECKESGLESMAVIVDANDHIEDRWKEIKYCLNSLKCVNVPQDLVADGLVLEMENGPRIGVWIMPNNRDAGELEEFLIGLIPDGDKLIGRVREFVEGLSSVICPHKDTSKAIVRIWLALQKEPESTFGQAIDQRLFDLTKPSCAAFVSWLGRLLMGPPPGLQVAPVPL